MESSPPVALTFHDVSSPQAPFLPVTGPVVLVPPVNPPQLYEPNLISITEPVNHQA